MIRNALDIIKLQIPKVYSVSKVSLCSQVIRFQPVVYVPFKCISSQIYSPDHKNVRVHWSNRDYLHVSFTLHSSKPVMTGHLCLPKLSSSVPSHLSITRVCRGRGISAKANQKNCLSKNCCHGDTRGCLPG